VRGEFLEVSGARLYYYAAGTRGSGDPILLLHGVPISGRVWTDVVPLLPGGHRVIVLDLLGCGRSDSGHRESLSIPAQAGRVAAVLDVLNVHRACVAGHGVGGAIAQWLAVHHPERVSSLALVSAMCFEHWPDTRLRMLRPFLPVLRTLPPRVVFDAVRHRLLSGHADARTAARSVERYMRAYAGAAGRDTILRHLRDLNAADTRALAPRLGEIAAPTTVLHGEHDPWCRLADARRLAHDIQHASLETVPDAGHYLPEEAPQRVAGAMTRLLARQAS
jgi:pimeloyl-ACP methyl ester carboxylesterase